MSPESKLVVDASVAIKWYVPEPGSDHAAPLLDGRAQLLAPDLLIAEFGNILWKKTRMGEMTGSEAAEIADAFVAAYPVIMWPSTHLLRAALDIAVTFRRTVYDGLYLALAVAENCPLITSDERFVRAMSHTQLQPFVRLLSAE